MVYLDLSDNRFSGAIPIELGALSQLRTLALSSNNLNGTIPAELGALSSLVALYLNDNQLSGTIPPGLGDLSSLRRAVACENNELSGTIPDLLGNLDSLRYSRFANNAFTGCVPDGLRYLLNQSPVVVDMVEGPAHDFTRDYDGDGDYDDQYDTEGLSLPFCGLSDLTLSGLTLEPAFSGSVEDYTASAAHSVASTTVSASLNPPIGGLGRDALINHEGRGSLSERRIGAARRRART